ncbi:MAG: glutathione peroxidase [Spirochaetia bacterium]|jgi:glutathione peroxidase
MPTTSILDFTMKDITGSDIALRKFEGRVLMVVNVASKCGLTPQYKGLQELYDRYKVKGFEILGFPANDFMWQEPGTDSQIQQFCTEKYSVSFPMFSKISVKGKSIHPLYEFLTSPEANPKFPGKIGWNFAKFLVDRKGDVVARFEPKTEPLAPEVIEAVEKALG